MVNEFDKEIDAILRKARGGETVALFDSHLDADEISAFAENALPEKSRQRYTAHLAECARCRKILSSVILLNSEAETVSASSAVSAILSETSVPWYRKLFALPQLVYVMGALVVLFSGFLGFLVLQSLTSQNSDVSFSPANRSAPQAQPTIFSSSESSSNSSSNTTTTTNSAPVSTNTTTTTTTTNTTTTTTNSAAQNSNAATAQQPVITAEPQNEVEREADKNLAKTKNDAPSGGVIKENQTKEEKKQSQTEDATRSRDDNKAMSQPAPQATPVPPSNAPKDMPKSKSLAGERRNVGGKTFQNVGGIWFDSAYSSQPQKTVNRGTSEYQKLDSGLRSIAESLSGTVVVVWKSKAYRIQ